MSTTPVDERLAPHGGTLVDRFAPNPTWRASARAPDRCRASRSTRASGPTWS